MNIKEALAIIHDLAYQNRIEDTEGEESLEQEQQRQDQALDIVATLSTGQVEEDNYGQLVIYTGLMRGPDGTLVDHIDEEEC